jgi:rRNA maturation protein Nop10
MCDSDIQIRMHTTCRWCMRTNTPDAAAAAAAAAAGRAYTCTDRCTRCGAAALTAASPPNPTVQPPCVSRPNQVHLLLQQQLRGCSWSTGTAAVAQLQLPNTMQPHTDRHTSCGAAVLPAGSASGHTLNYQRPQHHSGAAAGCK